MSIHAESNITLSTIPAKTSLLGGHFLYKSTTSQSGATPPSANVIQVVKKNGIDVSNDPTQWEFNTHIGTNGIKLRYNEIPLTTMTTNGIDLYSPVVSQGAITSSQYGMRLTSTGIDFYNPGTAYNSQSSPSIDAQLSSAGLKIVKGGIEFGTKNTTNYIYVWSDDDPNHSIRIGNSGDKTDWRIVAGNKFGVDKAGNLYASNASVTGNIVATSLTIDANNSTYDGLAAINITGYDIEILIDSTRETDTTTYLYPRIYHNGEDITDDYKVSTDTDIDNTKTYYTRSGSEGSYTYTAVTNPSGNPSTIPYYERVIILTHFIWYKDGESYATGDATYGGVVAQFDHNYRVTYAFDEGSVQEGIAVQDIVVDPTKYITPLSDTSIVIHPEDTIEGLCTLKINSNNIELVRNGIVIANYGSTAQIGSNGTSRFLMNADSLEAYNSNNDKYFEVTNSQMQFGNTSKFIMSGNSLQAFNGNTKYFEVSANGLSWGNNVAITTDDVDDAISAYITDITGGGVYVHASNTSADPSSSAAKGVKITDKIDVIRNGISVASYGESIVIGDENANNVFIDSTSIAIRDGYEELTSFGENGVQIGKTSNFHQTITKGSTIFYNEQSEELVNISIAEEGNIACSDNLILFEGYDSDAEIDISDIYVSIGDDPFTYTIDVPLQVGNKFTVMLILIGSSVGHFYEAMFTVGNSEIKSDSIRGFTLEYDGNNDLIFTAAGSEFYPTNIQGMFIYYGEHPQQYTHTFAYSPSSEEVGIREVVVKSNGESDSSYKALEVNETASASCYKITRPTINNLNFEVVGYFRFYKESHSINIEKMYRPQFIVEGYRKSGNLTFDTDAYVFTYGIAETHGSLSYDGDVTITTSGSTTDYSIITLDYPIREISVNLTYESNKPGECYTFGSRQDGSIGNRSLSIGNDNIGAGANSLIVGNNVCSWNSNQLVLGAYASKTDFLNVDYGTPTYSKETYTSFRAIEQDYVKSPVRVRMSYNITKVVAYKNGQFGEISYDSENLDWDRLIYFDDSLKYDEIRVYYTVLRPRVEGDHLNGEMALVIGDGVAGKEKNIFGIDWTGNMYMRIDEDAEQDTADSDLYNIINTLGWTDDIFI